jgi:metal-dependent amidase/aminoacylase/carboxypeptidase family protein
MKHSISFLFLLPLFVSAQTIDSAIAKNVREIMPKVVEWRRHFHQNPELSTREYKTGAFVADYLKSLGLEVKYPFAKTGVVAILKGRQTRAYHCVACGYGCLTHYRKS